MTEEAADLPQPLRIGFNEDFYPFSHGTGQQCDGIVIELAKAIFADIDCHIQLVPLTTGNIQEQLAQYDLDVIAGVAINEQRRKQIRFSEPIIQTGGAWFITAASSKRNELPKRVSSPGTGPLVSIISQKYPDIEVVKTENYSTALEAALSEAVDAAALNYHVGSYIAERDFPRRFILPEEPFYTLPLAMAFNHAASNTLIHKINRSLQALQSGNFVQRLVASYFRT